MSGARVGLRTLSIACALAATLATAASAQGAERARPATRFTVRAVRAPGAARRRARLSQAAPTTPFSECPAVGADTSCELLVDITDSGIVVYGDPAMGPYDGVEDTLIGVINDSGQTIRHLSLSSNTDLFGFDGNGLCTFGVAGCPFGSTGYEGPGTSFSNVSSDFSGGDLDFTGGLAPGATTYFSLEEALSSASVITGGPGPTEQGGGQNSAEHSTTCSSGRPVNCATGTFWHTFTDAQVPGNGVARSLTRTYSSDRAANDGPFGHGWSASYDMHLVTEGSGAVDVIQEDGAQVTFTPNGAGGFTAPPRVLASLQDNGDGTYTFRRNADQVANVFDAASGRLLSQTDRNGYTTTLSYTGGQLTSLTDPGGRALTLTYAGSHVASVTDPGDHTWDYSYDSDGNLVTAADPLNRRWSFTYDGAHRMLTMTDPRGGVTTNVYDSSGRVTRQADPAGRATTWAYTGDNASPGGGMTDMTNPRGSVTRYAYSNLELDSVTRGFGTSAAATTSYQYDAATLGVTSQTDPDGNLTTHAYDHDGNLLTTTDALGHTTSFTYNGFDEVTSRTDPLGNATSYGYDGNGNLTSASAPVGGATASRTYTYGTGAQAGDVVSYVDPNGKTTTYTYDDNGDQTSVVDPLGHTRTKTYDADGRMLTLTTANGHTMHYEYDAGGQLTKTTDGLGKITTYAYDGNGNRSSLADSAGHVTHYTYDADDELTATRRPNGTTVANGYDGAGNVVRQTNGNGHATAYVYDALDRVTAGTDPGGHRTTYAYDGGDNLTRTVDPSARATTYHYDADNQVVAIDYSDPATPDVSESYDAAGRRVSLSDGTGTSTFAYDELGQLTSETNGAGAQVAYAYDPAGNVTAITYPDGNTVNRTFDDAGRLSSVTDWLGHTSSFDYDADGNLTTTHLPGSVTSASTFDANDRLTGISDRRGSTPLAGLAYTRDAVGQVTHSTATGALAGAHAYGYDADNRLTRDNSDAYGYDAGDNAIAYVNGQTQSFDAADQLQRSTGRPGAARPGGTITVPGPTPQVGVEAQRSTHKVVSRRRLRVAGLTTAHAGDLVVAFVAGAPAGKPSGAGLAWSRVTAAGRHGTTVAIWQAQAKQALHAATITARLGRASRHALLSVVALAPGARLDGHGKASGRRSRARLQIAARANSLVLAVSDEVRGRTARMAVAQKRVAGAGAVSLTGTSRRKPASWALAAVTVQPGPRSSTTRVLPPVIPAGATRTFRYDAEGDRISTTAGRSTVTLGYDQASRLVSVSGGARYAYDGDGMRASKVVGGTTTRFAWDESGELPLLLQEAGTSYVYGPNGRPIEQVTGSTPTFLLGDQQGSTRLLTDAAGSVVGNYEYDAWGNVTKHTGRATNLQYDGQYTDAETGFQYLASRYYDPSTGQFLTVDPLVDLSRQSHGFAADSPLSLYDPSGQLFGLDTLVGSAIGAVTGTVFGVATYGISVAVGNRHFSWQDLGGAAAGGFVGGAVAGACEGTTWVALTACGAAGGAAGTVVQNLVDGDPWDNDLVEGAAFGAAGNYFGARAFPTRGFKPTKIRNLWNPGKNARRMYGAGGVGGAVGLLQGLLC